MKISNGILEVSAQNNGEINSIIFKGWETLHTSGNWWPKTYPMIWPVTSFSRSFVVEGKNYVLPKHGFWKTLNWTIDAINNNEMVLTARSTDVEQYPFMIEIKHQIKIIDNATDITTSFLNMGNDTAYFNFGHHPAFRIDEETILNIPSGQKPGSIDLHGKYSPRNIDLLDRPLIRLPFGEAYDTLIFKDFAHKKVIIKNRLYQIAIGTNDFNSLQIWKPKEALFVCIEPWQGWNDDEYDAPQEAQNKREIIKLLSNKTVTFNTKIHFY